MKHLFVVCILAISLVSCSAQYEFDLPPTITYVTLDDSIPECAYQEDPVLNRKRPTDNTKGRKLRMVLIDTNGQYVTNTPWNFGGPIVATGAGLSVAQLQAIMDTVKSDYTFCQDLIVFTFSESEYANKSNPNKRMRCIVTSNHSWYGNYGGASYRGSFNWGDDTPCFVFSAALGFNARNIAKAISHEVGHTLNCRHQSDCENGVNVNEYSRYKIMGYPYTAWSYFAVGKDNYCGFQDDEDVIIDALMH